jgi:hypothetical protein
MNRQIPLEVDILHETKKAFLCRIRDTEIWVPKSQIDGNNPGGSLYHGYRGTIRVSEWWIQTNELEYLIEEPPPRWESAVESLVRAQKTYRRLAAKYHPDRSPETAEVMKDINELWQAVLADTRNGSN